MSCKTGYFLILVGLLIPKDLTYRTCCCVLYNRLFLNSGGLIAYGSYLLNLLLCLVQPALNSGGLIAPKGSYLQNLLLCLVQPAISEFWWA